MPTGEKIPSTQQIKTDKTLMVCGIFQFHNLLLQILPLPLLSNQEVINTEN